MIKFTEEELKIWEEVFKPKLYDNKGLNKKKVMKYLLNSYKDIMEVMKVYHHVTNGLIMNPGTAAAEVIAVITDLDNQNLAAILKDEKEKWTKAGTPDSVVERVRDTCLVKLIAKLNQFHTSFEVVTATETGLDKYMVIWDNRSNSMQLKANKQLPEEWQDVAKQGIIWLMNSKDQKEMMITK